MKNIQKELDNALKILSRFSLNGDAVDVMAEAKRHIRIAKGIAGEYEKELTKEVQDDG